ncbi:MAG TPA: DUF2380 domain-containing protein [Steroidobacteraceae bacterium]|jgi:hypothetical protein
MAPSHRWIARGALALLLALCVAALPALDAASTALARLAVFPFELQDASAAPAGDGERTAEIIALRSITSDARDALQRSGRYSVINTEAADTPAVHDHTLHSCDGCDAPIALKLGADQSLVGVIVKVEPGSYAVEIKVRDARSGKVVNSARGTFLGGAAEWGGGVRSLLRHLLSDAAINPRG